MPQQKALKNARQRDRYHQNLEESRRSGRERRRKARQKNPAEHNKRQKAYRARDPEKWRTYSREWQRRKRQADPSGVREKKRVARLRAAYGLTPEEYDAMLDAQGHRCAGCGTNRPGSGGWNVDHCHKSKRVRGILCGRCNRAVGFARDNPSTLRRLADYLEG